MFYNSFKAPILVKTGSGILCNIDILLKDVHLYYPKKILVTQMYLYEIYKDSLDKNEFDEIEFVKGGDKSESAVLIEKLKNKDSLAVAFGGGSVLDIVKYCASQCDMPYITMPSTLSNDAIYSCVARLSENGKKKSFGVQPPVGIIVDFDIVRKSPKKLVLAGVADLVSNLSAIQDWKLAHKNIGEPINELAFMLAKEAAVQMLKYKAEDLNTDEFLYDLTNGLVTSGLSMIISGDTRGTSGSEHLISHAIDEYFSEKSTIHGLQVAWAHLLIEKHFRSNFPALHRFYEQMGIIDVLESDISLTEEDFFSIIPYARKIRNRYTVLNEISGGV